MPPSRADRKASKSSSKDASTSNAENRGVSSSLAIVGIGASAGGLEAFTEFLKALSPSLGMAYVFVTHLDPARESAFAQILARATEMRVQQIKNGLRVEVNNVYVIPPNCDLTIVESVLHIDERQEPRRVNMGIDIFFRSLARDQGKNAIGIIMSGTGSDGMLGVAAIKGEGGITFAEDALSAKHDSMPSNAIASGYVDFVASPEGIAVELANIRNHPYIDGRMSEQESVGESTDSAHMAQVFHLLRRTTGVDFSEYKAPTIGRRIQRRMALKNVRKLGEYSALLRKDRAEVQALYQDFLINVTNFFRNPESFEALRQEVYPAIVRARGRSLAPIRIWVPGCSTGEEAYSHAMSLIEFLDDQKADIPIQVFGTDLSDTAIARARFGLYKESIEADVSASRLRRFFHRSDSGYQISKAIREACIFSTQNVFNDPPFSRLDLISCRNVMIYLSQSLQRKVIPIFHYALNSTGFLMIGSTEGLLGAGSELFNMVDKKQKIYIKKPGLSPVAFGFSLHHPTQAEEPSDSPAPPTKETEISSAPIELQREADRLLIASYAPPAIVINENLEILHIRGRTGNYLELAHGKATLHLLQLARPGLLFELQKAVEEARHSWTEVRKPNVRVENDGKTNVTTIAVRPFSERSGQNHFLVVFEPPTHTGRETQDAPIASGPLGDDERALKDAQIEQLRQELTATKEYLQAIIEGQDATNEELQSANEEIQSGNEELQSTNEELQTSKEELESANEELHTVNDEMNHRNELLAQANNDLNNLLNNVNLSMVMVSPDLRVRRFTPQAGVVLGLINSDIDRPIPRLKLNIDVSRLEQMMLDVMRDVETKEFDLPNKGLNVWRLRISPYRTMDNRIAGAVLSIFQIEPNRSSAASEKLGKVPRNKPSVSESKKPSPKSRGGNHS